MEQFDLKKFLVENKLTVNSALLFEQQSFSNPSIAVKDKVAPALNKVISTATSKSKQAFDIVKKEFNEQNAQKALDLASKAYRGIKNVADKATSNPENLKTLSKLIPSLKNSAIGTALGAMYQIISGTHIESTGWFSKDIVWGDPTTALNVGIFLVALKLLVYTLQAIANIRKGASALKGIFKENEELANLDFSDIKTLFSKL